MDNQEKGKNPASSYCVKLADVDVNRISPCAPGAVENTEYVSFLYLYDLPDGSRKQAPLRIEFPKAQSDKIKSELAFDPNKQILDSIRQKLNSS
jgi:hypothetical protein